MDRNAQMEERIWRRFYPAGKVGFLNNIFTNVKKTHSRHVSRMFNPRKSAKNENNDMSNEKVVYVNPVYTASCFSHSLSKFMTCVLFHCLVPTEYYSNVIINFTRNN